MDSRTLVRRSLEFDAPPGIPRQTWVLPWAERHHPEAVAELKARFPDDLVSAPALYRSPSRVEGERYGRGRYVDEWGCCFDNPEEGIIGIVHQPRLAGWDDLDGFQTPEQLLDLDRTAIDAFCRGTDCFVLAGSVVRPFERLCFLRTMEQALVDLFERPPELSELLGRIHSHYCREVEAWADTAVDGIALMDDWGGQGGLLVAPGLFRELFKPLYRDYAEIARARGKYVFMHSDGWIVPLVEDFIEVGIHALNSQVHCMGVPELGEHYRGRITFWGEIDRQELLARGEPRRVRAAVQEVFVHLFASGGVIAQCEFGPGARPENVLEVHRTWTEIAEALA